MKVRTRISPAKAESKTVIHQPVEEASSPVFNSSLNEIKSHPKGQKRAQGVEYLPPGSARMGFLKFRRQGTSIRKPIFWSSFCWPLKKLCFPSCSNYISDSGIRQGKMWMSEEQDEVTFYEFGGNHLPTSTPISAADAHSLPLLSERIRILRKRAGVDSGNGRFEVFSFEKVLAKGLSEKISLSLERKNSVFPKVPFHPLSWRQGTEPR